MSDMGLRCCRRITLSFNAALFEGLVNLNIALIRELQRQSACIHLSLQSWFNIEYTLNPSFASTSVIKALSEGFKVSIGDDYLHCQAENVSI